MTNPSTAGDDPTTCNPRRKGVARFDDPGFSPEMSEKFSSAVDRYIRYHGSYDKQRILIALINDWLRKKDYSRPQDEYCLDEGRSRGFRVADFRRFMRGLYDVQAVNMPPPDYAFQSAGGHRVEVFRHRDEAGSVMVTVVALIQNDYLSPAGYVHCLFIDRCEDEDYVAAA